MFGTKSIFSLKQALNGLSERQRVTAGNIANVDTPGYKADKVLFEDELDNALARMGTSGTMAGSPPSIKARVVQAPSASEKVDGNTVDVDLEMATLAETTLRYEAASKLLAKKYANIRLIITEGRR